MSCLRALWQRARLALPRLMCAKLGHIPTWSKLELWSCARCESMLLIRVEAMPKTPTWLN